MNQFNMYAFLLKIVMFHCHISLPESTVNKARAN